MGNQVFTRIKLKEEIKILILIYLIFKFLCLELTLQDGTKFTVIPKNHYYSRVSLGCYKVHARDLKKFVFTVLKALLQPSSFQNELFLLHQSRLFHSFQYPLSGQLSNRTLFLNRVPNIGTFIIKTCVRDMCCF